MRTSGLPTDPKQPRKIAANGLNGEFAHILINIDVLHFFLMLLNCREIESGPTYLTVAIVTYVIVI